MWILYLFFSLMLICPTVLQFERGLLLPILLLGSTFKLKDFYVVKNVSFFSILTIATSIFFVCYGLLNKAPGAISISTVYIMWPVLFFVFIGTCSSVSTIKAIIKCFFYVGSLACVINLLALSNAAFIHNSFLYSLGDTLKIGYGIYEGYIEFSSPSITISILLFYFSLFHFLIGEKSSGLPKLHVIFALLLSCMTVLLSGRRAFWLMIIAAPIIALVFFKISGISSKSIKKIIPISIFVVLIIFIGIVNMYDFEILFEMFMSSFDFEADESNSIRSEQFNALIETWLKNPMIGQGLGAYAPKCIRDPKSVWSYELGYVACLMNFGILGFLSYGISTLWIFVASFKIVRKDVNTAYMVLPFLSCLLLMLAIHATNPYLNKFDYMWSLYIPILIINTLTKPKDNT